MPKLSIQKSRVMCLLESMTGALRKLFGLCMKGAQRQFDLPDQSVNNRREIQSRTKPDPRLPVLRSRAEERFVQSNIARAGGVMSIRRTFVFASMIAVAGGLTGTAFAGHGDYARIHVFCSETNCDDGAKPESSLLVDSNGNLYGTAYAGGTGNCGGESCGTLFEMTPKKDGGYRFSVLHEFCSEASCADGVLPMAGVVMDVKGRLYGTTSNGGPNDAGTAFEVAPRKGATSRFKVLYAFCSEKSSCGDGGYPEFDGLSYQRAAGGALYDGTSPPPVLQSDIQTSAELFQRHRAVHGARRKSLDVLHGMKQGPFERNSRLVVREQGVPVHHAAPMSGIIPKSRSPRRLSAPTLVQFEAPRVEKGMRRPFCASPAIAVQSGRERPAPHLPSSKTVPQSTLQAELPPPA
jgi:uncharacterized repeat protein (TIGR03803 family)